MFFDTSKAHPLFELVRRLSNNFRRGVICYRSIDNLHIEIQISVIDNKPVLEIKVHDLNESGQKIPEICEFFILYLDGKIELEVVCEVKSRLVENQIYQMRLNIPFDELTREEIIEIGDSIKKNLNRLCNILTDANTIEVVYGNPSRSITVDERISNTLTHIEMGFEAEEKVIIINEGLGFDPSKDMIH